MKQFCLFSILLFAASALRAQQAGQLYIVSYNDTADIGYVCSGIPQDTVFIGMGAVNLIPSVPITIDSFTFHVLPLSDTVNFEYLGSATNSIKLGKGAWYGSGPNWAASRPGNDTFMIIGYYNGKFTDTAQILFHAKNSSDLTMYGYTLKTIPLVGDYSIGGIQQAEELDTMHDRLDQPYIASTSPQETGLSDNMVTLRSCGGAVVDSILEFGNFSEFTFDPFPSLPYALKDDDSMVLRYAFTPHIVDTTGQDHHYLVFHTTDGHYLTWSFEYKVYPASSVAVSMNQPGIRVFPNPATQKLEIIADLHGVARLYDLLGRQRAEATVSGGTATLNVSALPMGTYILRCGSAVSSVVIAH